MNAAIILIVSIVVLLLAYHSWGGFVSRRLGVNAKNPAPSHTQRDGVDFEPAPAQVVLGHHFASIAGAGPIVGPIIAAAFGWLPALLWILVGSIFLGAVHDYGSLIASMRHQGRSIGELIEEYVGHRGKTLFLIFALATLILIIAVFLNAVIATFLSEPRVASSSLYFIIAAIAYGLITRSMGLTIGPATLLGIVLLSLALVAGFATPIALHEFQLGVWTVTPGFMWLVALLVYISAAAIAPVWILLQPRDYLNSFLLYAMMLLAVAGIVVARQPLQGDAFVGFQVEGVGFLFPLLFVTVACGAISGFHSLVASGTTSKQLDSEGDAKIVGYGGMLIEAVLAIIALLSVATLSHGDYMAVRTNPIQAFGNGVGHAMTHIGLPFHYGVPFIALVVSCFAITTTDTCTRLARFLLQELFESEKAQRTPLRILHDNRYVSTLLVAAISGAFASSGSSSDLWPIFGSANQMLSALALLAIATWLAKKKVKNRFVVIPMFFMYGVTVAALIQLILQHGIFPGEGQKNLLLAIVAFCLLLISLELLRQAVRVLRPAIDRSELRDSLLMDTPPS